MNRKKWKVEGGSLKRFIRYLYEYEQGRRTRNVGFVKVEQDENACVVHVHGKGFRFGAGNRLWLSLFFRGEGGICLVKRREEGNVNPALNSQIEYTREEFGQDDLFGQICGVFLENDAQKSYLAVWDDAPVNLESVRLWERRQAELQEPKSEIEESEDHVEEVQNVPAKTSDLERSEKPQLQEVQGEAPEPERREEAQIMQEKSSERRENPRVIREEMPGPERQEGVRTAQEKAPEPERQEEEQGEAPKPERREGPQEPQVMPEKVPEPERQKEVQGVQEEAPEPERSEEAKIIQEESSERRENPRVIREEMPRPERQEEVRTVQEEASEPGRHEGVRMAPEKAPEPERREKVRTVQEEAPEPKRQEEVRTAPKKAPEPERQRNPRVMTGNPGRITAVRSEGVWAESMQEEPPSPWVCCKIQRAQLTWLARREWRLANNQFLMHGYHNYHHLLLMEKDGALYLGVPGIYHRREARVAESFGFPEFIGADELRVDLTEEERDGEFFGYWVRRVMKR